MTFSGSHESFVVDGERRELVLRQLQAELEFMAKADRLKWLGATAVGNRAADALLELYFRLLPRPVMAVCPFDDMPLTRSFDPWGLDGPWWDSDSENPELPACPHFCLLRGAVHLNSQAPRAGDFDCLPGPEVPYLLPRLLEMPGMVAVLGRMGMHNGFTAYPVTYFAEHRPPAPQLAAGWGRKIYTWRDEFDRPGYRIDNEVWDFDLAAWIARGRVRWCPPESHNLKLNDPAAGDPCPYVDLPGRRENLKLRGSDEWSLPLPDGRELSPYDD